MELPYRQFGNILVLSATYKSESLSYLVEKTQLDHLFDRTIKFLDRLGSISKTLRRDMEILVHLKEIVFRKSEPYQSFSSSDG